MPAKKEMLYAPREEQDLHGLGVAFEKLGQSVMPALVFGFNSGSGNQEVAPIWYELSAMAVGGAFGEIAYEGLRYVRDRINVLDGVNRARVDVDRNRESFTRCAFVLIGAAIALTIYNYQK